MSCYHFYGIGSWIVNISFREMLEIRGKERYAFLESIVIVGEIQ